MRHVAAPTVVAGGRRCRPGGHSPSTGHGGEGGGSWGEPWGFPTKGGGPVVGPPREPMTADATRQR
jgi:hypothetical protein